MKKLLLSTISVLVLLVACQFKSEKDGHSSQDHSLQVKVGEDNNGNFTITYLDAIKEDWESKLSLKGKIGELKDFAILKGISQGEVAETYYLLSASTSDNSLRVAALLELEGKTFRFITNKDQNNADFYSIIICEGACETGCMPIVSNYGGAKYINCSSCADCRKNETEVR